jgi:hypothetical protein
MHDRGTSRVKEHRASETFSAAGRNRAVVDPGAEPGFKAELVKPSLVVFHLGGAQQLTLHTVQ